MTSGSTGETTLSGLSSLRALTSSTRYTVMCVWGVWVFVCGGNGGGCVCVGWVGSTEFKLWQLKRIIKLRGGESCS